MQAKPAISGVVSSTAIGSRPAATVSHDLAQLFGASPNDKSGTSRKLPDVARRPREFREGSRRLRTVERKMFALIFHHGMPVLHIHRNLGVYRNEVALRTCACVPTHPALSGEPAQEKDPLPAATATPAKSEASQTAIASIDGTPMSLVMSISSRRFPPLNRAISRRGFVAAYPSQLRGLRPSI